MIKAVIFDLDNTLAHTTALEDIRNRRDYDAITDDVLKTIAPYPKCRDFMTRLIEKGVKIGIVTNSGHRYAKKILDHLDLPGIETIVTYTDVGANGIKPAPDGIIKAISDLGLSPGNDIIYIGDHAIDVEAAYKAGVKPVVVSWGSRNPVSQIPSAVLNSEDMFAELGSEDEIDLIADRCAYAESFEIPKKQLYFAPLDLSANVVTLKEELKILCLGRYFSQKGAFTASLHDNHALSIEIFKKEHNTNYTLPDYLVDLVSHSICKIPEYYGINDESFDYITTIPAKKGKNPRLENFLSRIENVCETNGTFATDIFSFSSDAVSLKTLSKEGRFTEVSKSLNLNHQADLNLKGKTIIIIDDIITTGSTMRRAISLLEDAGASLVVGLVLAKTVSIFEDEKLCPKCSRQMRVQKNQRSGERFWGCTGYYDDLCSHTEPMAIKDCPHCGRSMFRRRNSYTGETFLSCEGWNKSPQCNHSEDET